MTISTFSLNFVFCKTFTALINTAVKRYTHARGLRKAREKQRQIVYK